MCQMARQLLLGTEASGAQDTHTKFEACTPTNVLPFRKRLCRCTESLGQQFSLGFDMCHMARQLLLGTEALGAQDTHTKFEACTPTNVLPFRKRLCRCTESLGQQF